MVERTNGSPWFFIAGIALIVIGLAVPLVVDALAGQVLWLVRGAGVLVAIGGAVLLGFGIRRRRGR
jgi:preprotein translocase subunit SecE